MVEKNRKKAKVMQNKIYEKPQVIYLGELPNANGMCVGGTGDQTEDGCVDGTGATEGLCFVGHSAALGFFCNPSGNGPTAY